MFSIMIVLQLNYTFYLQTLDNFREQAADLSEETRLALQNMDIGIDDIYPIFNNFFVSEAAGEDGEVGQYD